MEQAAGASQATAYRYFPHRQRSSQSSSREVWREVVALVVDPQTAGVGARIDRIIDAVVRVVYAEERQVLTGLRVYHDPDTRVRKGSRMKWIDWTISRLPAEVRESLRLALAPAIGPDP